MSRLPALHLASQEIKLGVLNFWSKAHPPLVSSALHSPPSSCTRCFPTTLNMSSLPPSLPLTLKRVIWGSPPEFFYFFKNLKRVVRGSSPRIFLNVYIAVG